jgi:hypothetical protein
MNLPHVVPAILSQDPRLHILVVDDNSPDGTGSLADRLSEIEPRVHVLHRTNKEGLGKAYIAGFRWALAREYEIIFEMDADFSHDPDRIGDFLRAIQDADLVLGSRYAKGVNVINWPISRLLLSLLFLRRGAAWNEADSPPAGFLRRGFAKLTHALRQYGSLSLRQLLGIVAVPVVGQILSAMVFFSAARALSLHIPPGSCIWLVSLVYFVTLVPATISGLGLREGALVLLLPHYGVPRADALAFSLLLFAITLALGVLGGVLEVYESLLKPHKAVNPSTGAKRSQP